jgi:hypothetical protein
MSAAEFIRELRAMPEVDRERIFATLIEDREWREDLLDLITLRERRGEPTRSIDTVFKDLNIDA